MSKTEEYLIKMSKYVPNEGKDPLDIEFGRRLKEIIQKRDMQQKAAIIDLKWTNSTFYSYSSGRKRMRVDRFAQLVDRLGLTQSEVAYLLETYLENSDG